MLRRSPSPRRRGALAVEAAFVYPVMIFLLLMLIVGGMGVFRYQQVAFLAREAARWAAVHGSNWQNETGQSAATQDRIRSDVVVPLAAAMDPAQLTVQVQWVNGATGQAQAWDGSAQAPSTVNAAGDKVTNRVRVTVSYTWVPALAGTGPLSFQSVSEVPMAF